MLYEVITGRKTSSDWIASDDRAAATGPAAEQHGAERKHGIGTT